VNRDQQIVVAPADEGRVLKLSACDFSFPVLAEIPEPFDAESLLRPTTLSEPYVKSYGFDVDEMLAHLGNPENLLVIAEVDQAPVAYVAVSMCWTGFALIDDIAVDTAHRSKGIARLLLDAALAWAIQRRAPGIRLETQSNNVAACRFYARYGFVLGGHDRYLYQGLHPGTRETALYWYLFLNGSDGSSVLLRNGAGYQELVRHGADKGNAGASQQGRDE